MLLWTLRNTYLSDSDFGFFRYISRRVIARSCGSSICSILRNFYTVFPSGHTNLHSLQQCMRVFFSPYPLQRLFSVVFLMIIILTGVRWCLTVFLICISLMLSHVEHLFICLLPLCIPSGKMSLQFSCPFFNWGFLCWVVWAINIYISRY